jgi:hypothetical protein
MRATTRALFARAPADREMGEIVQQVKAREQLKSKAPPPAAVNASSKWSRLTAEERRIERDPTAVQALLSTTFPLPLFNHFARRRQIPLVADSDRVIETIILNVYPMSNFRSVPLCFSADLSLSSSSHSFMSQAL